MFNDCFSKAKLKEMQGRANITLIVEEMDYHRSNKRNPTYGVRRNIQVELNLGWISYELARVTNLLYFVQN